LKETSENQRASASSAFYEITNISAFGLWLLVDDQEYFVPFSDCPVFQEATVVHICNIQRLSPRQFHWPGIDADIELDALETPERFPLWFR
jgi:hypothetical protein